MILSDKPVTFSAGEIENEIVPESSWELISSLHGLLSDNDPSAVDVADKILELLKETRLARPFTKVYRRIADFDFDKAEKILKKMEAEEQRCDKKETV